MSFLGRLKSFLAGGSILSQDFDDEFQQIESLLDGTSTTKEVKLKGSDVTNPILIVDQLGTAGIFGTKTGANNSRLGSSSDQIVSQSAVVPIVTDSSVLCANLNADKLNGLDSSGYETGLSSFLVFSAFYADLTASSNPKKAQYIVPDGQTITITKLKAQQRKATASGNASTVIEFRKNGASIGTITINSNSVLVTTNDIGDVTATENDVLSFNINSHVGTTKHEDITATFHFKKLFNNIN